MFELQYILQNWIVDVWPLIFHFFLNGFMLELRLPNVPWI